MSVDNESIKKDIFYQIIKSTLENHPDWLDTAIHAINDGFKESIDKLKEELSKKDKAFLCALSLTKKERLSKEVVDWLNEVIIEKIKENSSITDTEKDFIKESE